MKRHLIVKILLVIAYLALTVVMFRTGRTHVVLIDNRDDATGTYKAVSSCYVSVQGGKSLEFFKNDRDKFTVKGQTANISIEFPDGRPARSFDVKIPFKAETVLVSVPKLLAGLDAVEPFEM